MTTPDPYDARLAVRASGLLAQFNAAGVLTAADVHVALRLGRLGGHDDQDVLLAAALAVRAVRLGSVCVQLDQVAETATAEGEEPVDLAGLPWPATSPWLASCAASPLVADGPGAPSGRPLRLVDGLLYLDRYWRQEELVRHELAARAAQPVPAVDPDRLRSALALLFPGSPPDAQRLATAACATGWVTVVAGGPGTGKTTTVARMLALLGALLDEPPRIALAAPTAKAAARLQQAVAAQHAGLQARGLTSVGPPTASTLHRLLGSRPGSRTRFRHDRTNRLPFDVVVVDETSMVSLTLMSRLLEALRPETRLVLVGDPDQLASVEAGAVLGDLVGRAPRTAADARADLLRALLPDDVAPAREVVAELGNDVVRLRTTHRYSGGIGELAEAVRQGDADAALAVLRSGADDVAFVPDARLEARVPRGLDALRADVLEAGGALLAAARAGDEVAALDALDRHRVLCAHRRGPYGVGRWNDEVERWLDEAFEGYALEGDGDQWYVGRPLIATTNDYDVQLFNGDTGVVVDHPERGRVAAFGRGGEPVLLPPSRLSAVQTMHAMTVHRGQGSQFDRVSVLLPAADSPLLTRELFYTAVTRAAHHVRVIGTEDAVRAAVTRPVVRASGLGRR